jgi:Swt1-like HEPN
MAIREQLRNVLSIIAEFTHNNASEDVPDTWVIDRINVRSVAFVISEFQREILRLLYEKWFHDYIVGVQLENFVSTLGRGRNDVSQSLEILQSHFLAQDTEIPGFYRITVLGIDAFERGLSPSLFHNKVQERKRILELLLEPYQKDTKQQMQSDELMKRINRNERYYLLGNVEYLEQKGLVKLNRFHGGRFFIRLTAKGFQSIQDVIVDNARVMSCAYETLFRIENRLRQFIESKLRSKYGSDWWEKYVSHKIKKNVQDMRQMESSLSWKVSTSEKITDYLLFEHLELIITNNWDVFKSVFHNQKGITHRLGELDSIRNSIAHTRVLSRDGMERLEKYSRDLLNMVS